MFTPNTWGRKTPNLTVAYFSDGLVVQPPTKTKLDRGKNPQLKVPTTFDEMFLFNAAVTWAVDLTVGWSVLDWWISGWCWCFLEGQENPTRAILPFNAWYIQRYCQIQENIGWFPQLLVTRKHEPENSEIIWCRGQQEDAKMQEQMLAQWICFYQITESSSTLKMLVLMTSSFWRCQLVEILGF